MHYRETDRHGLTIPVFVFSMQEGMTQCFFTRAELKTLEESFALALRDDYTVASLYLHAASERSRTSDPVSMEIDAIDVSRGRGNHSGRDVRSRNMMKCFRCCKTGHHAVVCRVPAPLTMITAVSRGYTVSSVVPQKKRAVPEDAKRPSG